MISLFNTMDAYLAGLMGIAMDSILISLINAAVLILGSLTIFFLIRGSVIRLIRNFIIKIKWGFGSYLIKHKLFTSVLMFLPITLVFNFSHVIGSESLTDIIVLLSQVALVVVSGNLIFTILNAVLDIMGHKGITKKLPIKSFVQLGKIITIIVCSIIVIAYLMGKSPVYLLGSLGAISAVLFLVFKDSILGLVASIQLTANKMVGLGDWIEVAGADGEVTDISLTTVSIENWDHTTTTLPAYDLINKPMKNWTSMYGKGRRIKRAINIDSSTVKFISQEEMDRLSNLAPLKDYMVQKTSELKKDNRTLASDDVFNKRQLTNLGTFRAFLESYLKHHPAIAQNRTLIVRQLESTNNGIPIQIYTFLSDPAWVEYEKIQSDLFDYIFAILPLFELSHFQVPSGKDIQKINLQ